MIRSALSQNLSPLIELQKLDLRIAEIKEQRRKIPERLQAVDSPLREARQLHQQTSGSVETLVKERRSYEQDLEAHEAHTEKMKSRLSELKSNKEYQAHLFEIEVANKKKGDIEEKILLCMEKVEQLQRAAKEAQEKLSTIENHSRRKNRRSMSWNADSQRNWRISNRSSKPARLMSKKGFSVAITRSKRRARIMHSPKSRRGSVPDAVCSFRRN